MEVGVLGDAVAVVVLLYDDASSNSGRPLSLQAEEETESSIRGLTERCGCGSSCSSIVTMVEDDRLVELVLLGVVVVISVSLSSFGVVVKGTGTMTRGVRIAKRPPPKQSSSLSLLK